MNEHKRGTKILKTKRKKIRLTALIGVSYKRIAQISDKSVSEKSLKRTTYCFVTTPISIHINNNIENRYDNELATTSPYLNIQS